MPLPGTAPDALVTGLPRQGLGQERDAHVAAVPLDRTGRVGEQVLGLDDDGPLPGGGLRLPRHGHLVAVADLGTGHIRVHCVVGRDHQARIPDDEGMYAHLRSPLAPVGEVVVLRRFLDEDPPVAGAFLQKFQQLVVAGRSPFADGGPPLHDDAGERLVVDLVVAE